MPQLDPTWFASQLFWLCITFAVLYFVLSRVVLPPLLDVTARRQQTVTGDIEQAQSFKAQADSARQEYERLMAETRAQAQQLTTDALAAHKAKSDAADKEMDRQIEQKLRDAKQRITARKEELITALTPTAAELTSLIVEKLTQRALSNDQVNRVIGQLSKSGR